ncbi:N-lysine methyltransferase KMT5A-like, partial [Montipora capricornis]|uniref:N-lysine methyltransferase KMT5A-like n=1 Tax=Montipora capricornis TaxID=246305 RepID=UPI0035F1E79B
NVCFSSFFLTTKKATLQKEQLVPRYLTEGIDQEGFEERFIDNFIGRGVFTTKEFSKGQFLLEYKGELISQDEGYSREQSYDEDLGSFLFFLTKVQRDFVLMPHSQVDLEDLLMMHFQTNPIAIVR